MTQIVIQVQTDRGWQTLPTKPPAKPGALTFAHRALADFEALLLSATNEDLLFRVAEAGKPMTDAYPVFSVGRMLMLLGDTLIDYPTPDSDVLVLDKLIEGKTQQQRCEALGRLVARWAQTRERVQQVVAACIIEEQE
jgi:hypothetical protein